MPDNPEILIGDSWDNCLRSEKATGFFGIPNYSSSFENKQEKRIDESFCPSMKEATILPESKY